MRGVDQRRASRALAVRDRVILAVVGACAVGGITAFGWLGRQIGVTSMKFVLFGVLLLVAAALVLVVLRLRERGIRPPGLKELVSRPAAEAADEPEPTARP